VSGLCAPDPARAVAVTAVAVAGLPASVAELATSLGLLPEQFGATRDDALEAELDVPSGRWRVWPDRGVGLWVSGDATPPPLTRVTAELTLDLRGAVSRLGGHGIWLYEGRILRGGEWSGPLPLKSAYPLLADADAVCGSFAERGRSEEALLERSGRVRMRHPARALRWLEISALR
jgi:hypothetical protein